MYNDGNEKTISSSNGEGKLLDIEYGEKCSFLRGLIYKKTAEKSRNCFPINRIT
jgi:hypothetical protein